MLKRQIDIYSYGSNIHGTKITRNQLLMSDLYHRVFLVIRDSTSRVIRAATALNHADYILKCLFCSSLCGSPIFLFHLCTWYRSFLRVMYSRPAWSPRHNSLRSLVSELEIVLRMVQSIRGHGMHRVRRRWCVEAVVRVRLRPGELAVSVLFRRRYQEDWPQRQGFTRARYTLRLIDIARIHLAYEQATS